MQSVSTFIYFYFDHHHHRAPCVGTIFNQIKWKTKDFYSSENNWLRIECGLNRRIEREKEKKCRRITAVDLNDACDFMRENTQVKVYSNSAVASSSNAIHSYVHDEANHFIYLFYSHNFISSSNVRLWCVCGIFYFFFHCTI